MLFNFSGYKSSWSATHSYYHTQCQVFNCSYAANSASSTSNSFANKFSYCSGKYRTKCKFQPLGFVIMNILNEIKKLKIKKYA